MTLIKSKQIQSLEASKITDLVLYLKEKVELVENNKFNIQLIPTDEIVPEEVSVIINGVTYESSCLNLDNLPEVTWVFNEDQGGFDLEAPFYVMCGTKKSKITKMSNSTGGSIDLTNVETDILPKAGSVINIGSKDRPIKSIYADEVRVSANTLYIDGVPVLGSTSEDIVINADIDQGLSIKTRGLGATKIASEYKVDILTTGVNADVDIKATGSDSKVNINGQSQVNITAPKVNLNGETTVQDLTVTGNVNIKGTTTTVDSVNLVVKDNIIELNKDETGNGVSAGSAGFKINRGDASAYMAVYEEATQEFKIGETGNTKAVATKDYVNEKITEINSIAVATDNEVQDLLDTIFA